MRMPPNDRLPRTLPCTSNNLPFRGRSWFRTLRGNKRTGDEREVSIAKNKRRFRHSHYLDSTPLPVVRG
jgi:hypothetical protein